MECMIFHVNLLNFYTIFWDGGHVAWGGNIGLNPG